MVSLSLAQYLRDGPTLQRKRVVVTRESLGCWDPPALGSMGGGTRLLPTSQAPGAATTASHLPFLKAMLHWFFFILSPLSPLENHFMTRTSIATALYVYIEGGGSFDTLCIVDIFYMQKSIL